MGVLMKNKVCYTGGNVKVQPVIYSTDEREIGVWTDGKPLYQKTIYCGATGGYETTVSVNHDISNIDKFIFIFGCFGDGEPVPTVNGGSDYIRLSADSTKIYIKYKDSWETHTDISVTIQYTKTTDTPGSGIWATNGAPAKHYSTTEQVIGTWIDGKSLYQKVISWSGTLSLSTSAWTTIPFDDMPQDTMDFVWASMAYTGPIFDNRVRYQYFSNDNLIKAATSQSGGQDISSVVLILNYTKSTS